MLLGVFIQDWDRDNSRYLLRNCIVIGKTITELNIIKNVPIAMISPKLARPGWRTKLRVAKLKMVVRHDRTMAGMVAL